MLIFNVSVDFIYGIDTSPDEIVVLPPAAAPAPAPALLALEYRPDPVDASGARYSSNDVRERATVKLTGLRQVVITSRGSRGHRRGGERPINITLEESEVEVVVASLKVDRKWYESKDPLYLTFCFDFFNRGSCEKAECRHVHDTEEGASSFFAGRLGVGTELRAEVTQQIHLTAVKRKAAAEGLAGRGAGGGGNGNIGECPPETFSFNFCHPSAGSRSGVSGVNRGRARGVDIGSVSGVAVSGVAVSGVAVSGVAVSGVAVGGVAVSGVAGEDVLVVERRQDPPSRVGAVVHHQLHPVVVVWQHRGRQQCVRVTELARLLELEIFDAGAARHKLSVVEGYLKLSRRFVESGEGEAAWFNLSSAASVAADPSHELGEEDMEIVSALLGFLSHSAFYG